MTVSVAGVNHVPVASSFTQTLPTQNLTLSGAGLAPAEDPTGQTRDPDQTVTVDLLGNAKHGPGASAAIVGGPNHGVLAANPDGSFSYTPDFRFTGVDTFTYDVSDRGGTSNVATVSLDIAPVNLTILGDQPNLAFWGGPGSDQIFAQGGGEIHGGGGSALIDPGQGRADANGGGYTYVTDAAGPTTLELTNGNHSNFIWNDFNPAKGDLIDLKGFAPGTMPQQVDYGNGSVGLAFSDGSWGYVSSTTPLTSADFKYT